MAANGGTDLVASGTSPLTVNGMKSLTYVKLFGQCEQNGTPAPDAPVDIVCNNGVLKWDSVNQRVYADGTAETIADDMGGTAVARDLLSVGGYSDSHSVMDGVVTRRVAMRVLNGTENWSTYQDTFSLINALTGNAYFGRYRCLCSHYVSIYASTSVSEMYDKTIKAGGPNQVVRDRLYIKDSSHSTVESLKGWLASEYDNGTPVMVLYVLENAVEESVAGQPLTIRQGTNVFAITQASLSGLEMEVGYKGRP